MAVWYATREQVKSTVDAKETARNNAQIDRALDAATDSIVRLMRRRFEPMVDTRLYGWPRHVDPSSGSRVLSLDEGGMVSDYLVSYTEITVDGIGVDGAHVTLLPANAGPPYTAIEVDSTVTLLGDTERRAVGVSGVFGDRTDDLPVGALSANLNSGASSTASVSWTTANIGVGDILRIDAERLIVADRTMVDSTQNLGGAGLTAAVNHVTVPVSNGTGFAAGEVILIESERMLVVDIAGSNLTVRRAWDGSTLATHAAGVDIYTLTGVELDRGQLGTVDADHLAGATIYRHRFPALINQLCVAEAIVAIQQETSAYARVVGADDAKRDAAGGGIEDLRRRAYQAHARKGF